jgi:uncharacterized protein
MLEKQKTLFIKFILNRPKMALSIGMILTALFTMGGTFIKSNFTPRIWFSDDYPQIIALDNFEKRFGGDQFIAVGFYTKDEMISEKNLGVIKEMTNEMWKLKDVIRVDSIDNFNVIESNLDDINITPLVEDIANSDKVRRNLEGLKEIQNYLIDREFRFTLIYAQMKPLFGESPNYKSVMQELKNLISKYETRDNRFILMGNVPVTDAFREIADSDNKKIIPFMFGFVLILLILFFRSLSAVATPLLISLFCIASVFGLMGHLGLVYNSILAAVPGILLAICLADTIHIMATFYFKLNEGENIPHALEYSLNKNFIATVLTTFTTAVSFITISFTELIPIRDLGILAGVGTIIAWFYTFLFLPPIFLLLPEKWVRMLWRAHNPKTAKESKFSHLIMQYKFQIIFLFAVIFISSIFLSLKNEVNSDPLKYFAEDTKIKEDYNFTKQYIDGIRSIEVEIDSENVDGIKNPEFLLRVKKFIDEVMTHSEIVLINSILDPLQKMNQELNGGEARFYTVPSSQEQVAEALLLYTMGLPANQGIENYVSMDNRYLRVNIKWNVETTSEAMAKDKEVHQIAKKYNLKTTTGGYFPIYVQVNNKVVDSFFKSMGMAILFVSLIILFFFKQPLLAVLAMLPNIIPLTFGAAFMAINKIYIDIGTSIVSAICLGIAVDDTIHFITHYILNKKRYGDTYTALNETFLSTGKALILTTLMLVVGFGSFMMADFLPNHYFGILCALVLTFALLTDLLLLPSILILWDKRKKST